MMKQRTVKVLAVATMAVVLGAFVPGRQGGGEPLRVSAIRFYQPANATTTIEVECEVDLPALLRGVAQTSRYRVEIAVLDSAGLELRHSSWTREVPAGLAHARAATAVESFGFDAAPGGYRVRVRLTPSAGDPLERTVEVAAYRSAPKVSDLLLASAVRQPGEDSELLVPGEIRRGGLAMQSAPLPRLTPAQATLSWYAEAYPGADATGELRAEVVGAGGRRIVATAPRAVTFPAAGGITRGSLDLAGLPEGSYQLRLHLRLGDSDVVVEAPFAMGSVASLAAADAAASAPAAAPPEDMFDGVSEDRLDSLRGPLVYVARNPDALRLYQTLTADGKRRFLREFWTSADMRVQGSAGRDDFYHAVAYVNSAFRESGAGQVPGWNTDRGRVYLKNGRPDETLDKPQASPSGYQVWRYTRGRPRWYIFLDRTGMGHFVLLATSDLRESGYGQTDWASALGTENARDVSTFLGLQDPTRTINQ